MEQNTCLGKFQIRRVVQTGFAHNIASVRRPGEAQFRQGIGLDEQTARPRRGTTVG